MLLDVEQRLQASSPSSDPLLLGLSAGLSGERVRIQSRTLHLLLRDSQTPGARPGPASTPPPLTQARARLQALRDTLERVGGGRVAPQTPLGLFLQREWDGLVRAADSLEATLTQPERGCAPPPALHTPPPALRTPPPALRTLSRLEARAPLLGAYLRRDSPETPPYAYRLSAFHNPRGFLAALLREAARAEKRDPSRLSLRFQVRPPRNRERCGRQPRSVVRKTM